MNHLLLPLTLGGIALTACSGISKEKEQVPARPNVILFLTDDNAFEYWGYGGGPKLSPTIDSLAAQGVNCQRFYCTSAVSTPSRYSLHTGKYAGHCADSAFRSKFPDTLPYSIEWNTNLDASKEFTLGEMYQEGGYATGFVGKWHLGFDHSPWHFSPSDDPANPEVSKRLKAYEKAVQKHIAGTGFDMVLSAIPDNNDMHPIESLRYHNLEWYARGAMKAIDSLTASGKPFFLIINITTHHGPCHEASIDQNVNKTPYGFDRGLDTIMPSRSSIYSRITEKGYPVDFKTSGTVWTDDCVNAILSHLRKRQKADKTAIIFTSDHNRYDGKSTCYEGGVNTPFVMSYPEKIESGTVNRNLMQMTDLMPTLAEMCSISLPEDLRIDGKSQWPALSGKNSANVHKYLYFEMGYTRAILSEDGYKYIALRFPTKVIEKIQKGDTIYNIMGDKRHQPTISRYPHLLSADQLYELSTDPNEQVNRFEDKQLSAKRTELQEQLKRYLALFNNPFVLENTDPVYLNPMYKKMQENAKKTLNMNQFYWYQQNCY